VRARTRCAKPQAALPGSDSTGNPQRVFTAHLMTAEDDASHNYSPAPSRDVCSNRRNPAGPSVQPASATLVAAIAG
jgi:hypothetical protein